MKASAKPSILIVEDEPEIAALLQEILEKEGMTTTVVGEGKRAIEIASRISPTLIVLDLGLPDASGLDVCRQLKQRGETKQVPVVFLTGRKSEGDIVLGLEMGGDDYVTKPFQPREIVARIKAVIRRGMPPLLSPAERMERGPLSLDASRFEVKVSGEAVPFTLSEFRILWSLAETPGRVFTRDQLLDKMSPDQINSGDRTIDVHIASIRKKLGREGKKICAIRGIGYKLTDDSAGD